METSLDAERLLSIAVTVTSEQRVESVLLRTVQGLAVQPGVALARIWLLPSIHLPSSWQQPPDTPEGMEHLHLVASAGTPIDSPGEDWSFLQGHFARCPMHVGKVGQVAAERHPILVKDVACEDSWIVRPEWAKREGIRSFAGYPLVFRDNLLGVIAVFSRRPLGDQEFAWLGLFANYAAVAIANTRAFEDLKKAEEALRSSERNLNQIINAIPTFVGVMRADGTPLYGNQGVTDYLDLTLEEMQRGDFRARIFHPEDLGKLREARRVAFTRPEPFENEIRVLGKDGNYRAFLFRYKPLLNEAGTIDRWFMAALDIEDRKRAEAELKQAYLHLTEAQRLSKTGSFITDLLADEHNWSEELYRIFEFDPATRITHEAIRTVFHPEDLAIYEAAFKHAGSGVERDLELTYRIITPAGNVKHVRAVAHLVETPVGRPVFIGAIQDVTASKVAEEALNRARAELAHMARVTTLSALTASIGHEVNQPITGVITSADACLRWLNRDQPDVRRARDAVMRIQEDGQRAADIIGHLKSFYRKDVSPRRDQVSANDVVREMLALLRSEADRHALVMRTELAAGLPMGKADRVQVQQVLMNLMLNGMEATGEPGGELTIRTRCDGGAVVVSVKDTGEGIPAETMAQIFNAFFTTKAGGTGMGLAISRAIIESHGGRLWATVNPDRGATFHFTLPTDLRPQ